MNRSRMTLEGWLDEHGGDSPPALAQRVRDAALAIPEAVDRTAPGAALEASLALLDSLLVNADLTRAGALGLLTADALITYAFEAAAEDPERLDALGEEAVRRIGLAAQGLTQ